MHDLSINTTTLTQSTVYSVSYRNNSSICVILFRLILLMAALTYLTIHHTTIKLISHTYVYSSMQLIPFPLFALMMKLYLISADTGRY